jgi:hypothetical protein
MSYAIPLPRRPRLDFYKKLAKELLRASSDAFAEASTEPSLGEGAVRAWAVRWLEASGWFRDASETAAVFHGQRNPRMLRAEWIESRSQELRKKKGAAPPLLADAQFFLAREHGFPSWPKFAEQVRALENRSLRLRVLKRRRMRLSRARSARLRRFCGKIQRW